MIDIVCPNGNELEFIQMAKALGYSGLVFHYDRKFTEMKNGMKIYYAGPGKGALLLKSNPLPQDFGNKNIDVYFDMESAVQKDKLNTPSSGFNHVVAQQVADHDALVGFSFSRLLDARNRQVYLARLRQNIKLCRKYKVEMAVFSFASSPYEMRSPSDLMSLFTVLGMHPKEAKDALDAVSKRVDRNIRKKKGLFIMKGLEKEE